MASVQGQTNSSDLGEIAISTIHFPTQNPKRPRSILVPSTSSDLLSPPLPELNHPPPSANSFRTNFETPQSPRGSSFSTKSSTPPPNSVPPTRFLSASFNSSPSVPSPISSHRRAPSVSFGAPPSSPRTPTHTSFPISPSSKRHARIHSRNLSVFFPRPGTEAATRIHEDEGDRQDAVQSSPSIIPSSPMRSQSRLGEGFKFGGHGREGTLEGRAPLANVAKRRGHHHKHSLSHNFFSFMDPGGSVSHGSPPIPTNEWATSPPSLPPVRTTGGHIESEDGSAQPLPITHPSPITPNSVFPLFGDSEQAVALAFCIGQFIARGSLACTGLGYWVVFDSFGVALSRKAIPWIWPQDTSGGESNLKRPFGSRRVETTASFSQSIYLIFSAVYVLKEAVEHFLLASGDGEAPHHHRGNEHTAGIAFPATLLWLSIVSLLFSNLYYRNHSRLVDATGSSLPDPATALSTVPFLRRAVRPIITILHSSPMASRVLSNPFTMAPVSFSCLLLYATYFAEASQHVSLDMLISSLETVWTLSIAYPTAVTLGKILLQTAPERLLPGAPMELFLRTMRELERHPQVVHLPAPRFWQVTPPRLALHSNGEAELVATIELHVHKELTDVEILELTRWASDRCSVALGKPRAGNITIAVVRG
ncbi:hypothetical protein BS47DRAFT_1337850 [Hydnum rufescens UP504]|uniref:Cation efflux protein transmembrane domain-containing protein n=1 Tax=Hydnum rufescens UP504 TaxID=1448309 RepID=A0A9P6B733_9AGAM|nr:hypothetical protein BS47DRAFT_1337850 [Hydnum rufescens UP504]